MVKEFCHNIFQFIIRIVILIKGITYKSVTGFLNQPYYIWNSGSKNNNHTTLLSLICFWSLSLLLLFLSAALQTVYPATYMLPVAGILFMKMLGCCSLKGPQDHSQPNQTHSKMKSQCSHHLMGAKNPVNGVLVSSLSSVDWISHRKHVLLTGTVLMAHKFAW